MENLYHEVLDVLVDGTVKIQIQTTFILFKMKNVDTDRGVNKIITVELKVSFFNFLISKRQY